MILQFPTILEMLDFESVVRTHNHNKDRHRLTILGHFEEADIELAMGGYNAIVIEEAIE